MGARGLRGPSHFDDEPSAGADEVTDVTCQRHLTTEGDAQLAIHERRPEQAFWRRCISPHAGSARSEEHLALTGNGASAQESLLRPAKRPAAATAGAASVPAPHRSRRPMPGLARRVRAAGVGRPRPGLRRRAHRQLAIDAELRSARARSGQLSRYPVEASHDALPPRPPAAKRGRTLGGSRRAEGPTQGGIANPLAFIVFGPKSLAKHKLGGVLNAFGGDKVAAFNALEGAAQQLANQGAIKGVFQTTVEVAGQTVTVRGQSSGARPGWERRLFHDRTDEGHRT